MIGPMNFDAHAALPARFGKVTNLNRAYVKLRRVKSAEELDWFRIGAWLSDRGMEGLRNAIKPGVSERELADAVERGYVGLGGTTGIHFIGTTPMRDPQVGGAVAVSFLAARGGGRHRVFGDHRDVLGPFRPGVAQLHRRRGADAALSRPACGGRRRVRRHRQGAAGTARRRRR